MPTFLIQNGAVLAAHGWLEPGYVFIEDERVTAAGPGRPPPERIQRAETVIDARHMAVLPGLTNGHTHFSQTFMRGLAGGRPLLTWLKELIWPIQSALTSEELDLAARLALLENLRSGATEVVNHHKVAHTSAHTDAVCRAAEDMGLHVTVARAWADRGARAETPGSILEDLERLFQTWRGAQHVAIANGPLVPWRCSAETLQKTTSLARRYGAPTHLHAAETAEEVQMTLDETGRRPITWLDELGILGPDTHIVHGVWLDEDEIRQMAQRHATVVHCPVSNAVLGSGIAPLAALRNAGVPVRLGTDGPASNDTQDLFETIKQTLCLARAATQDPTTLSPAHVLAMALCGRVLAPGAPADVILVNLNHSRAAPVHDVFSALALCTHGPDVDTVIVGGQLLMRGGHVLALDETALLEDCRAAVQSLRARLSI